jgi:hypothetical protein
VSRLRSVLRRKHEGNTAVSRNPAGIVDRPIVIEVLAYAPTAFFHCKHCEFVWQQTGASTKYHQEQLESALPADLMQEYQQLSDWVRQMIDTYGNRVQFKLVDAASIEGWLKSLRYWVHRYPAVIVDGKDKCSGADREKATELIRQRVAAA